MKKAYQLPILAHLSAPIASPVSAGSSTPQPFAGWWSWVVWQPLRVAAALLVLTAATPAALAQNDPTTPPPNDPTAATQTLRGTVTDAQSGLGLPGATVRLVGTDRTVGTVTTPDGTFRLAGVPLGRQTVRISMIGYRELTVPNVIVNAGKEAILTVQLQESLTQLDEAQVVAARTGDKRTPNNEMALVSARTFDVETTNRFAGARNDPARMAQNFAGVGGSNDSRNDIVVRGNSPAGLLWRLEGVAIPNPNHYGGLGATGGPVSILNNNMLDKSDFLTAAFPATYANALSGVFDLQLRPGNNQKREYLAQVGINGFELGAEGPVRAKELPADAGHGKSSYLINYRYSTLGAFKAIGLSFGTGAAVPEYQDLSFKFDAPRKNGRWTVWGMGGMSKINLLGSDVDTTKKENLYGDQNIDSRTRFRMGVAGASYTHYLGLNSFAKIIVTTSGSYQNYTQDSLSREDRHPVPQGMARFTVVRQGTHALVSHKFSARDNAVVGVLVDRYEYELLRGRLLPGVANGFGTLATDGSSIVAQGYAQWQHRFSERLSATAGVTVLHTGAGDATSVEPRGGLKWQLDENSTISAGVGLHSQMQGWQIYNVRTQLADGTTVETNRNLGLTKATHYALAYERLLTANLRVKLEGYYQELRNAPVEMRRSSFSMLNAGADFVLPDNDSLVNKGTGRNYGVELTLERTFANGYFFLLTGSVFDSKYKGSDGVLRNTAFNGHYVTNLLAGKEWQMGPNGRNVLSFGLKLTASGGRYTTPIDREASLAAGIEKYQTDKAYTRQVPAYYRADIRIGYKLNRARLTHEFALDVQNVTDRKNVFSERFNVYTGQYATEYQLGLFPIPLYRLTF